VTDLRILAAVAVGGTLGCVARYGLGGWLTRGDFPWGTVAVNLLGSFALGFLVFSDLERGWLGPEQRMFLTVGFLGGFTTMSSFAVEFVDLAASGDAARAGLYYLLNAGATVLAAVGGRAAAMAVG
jgi:CrcB protein